MSLLERLDKAAVLYAQKGVTGRTSPFCYQWTRDDTRQLLEDAAKEIRARQIGFRTYVQDTAEKLDPRK